MTWPRLLIHLDSSSFWPTPMLRRKIRLVHCKAARYPAENAAEIPCRFCNLICRSELSKVLVPLPGLHEVL